MQWLIQCTDLPDIHTLKLLEVVKARSLPFVGIGVRPFTHEIIDLDKADPKAQSMFYGSIQLIHIISKWKNYRPGAFYQKEWFDPRACVGKRSDLLNENLEEITVAKLRSNWVNEPMFVKSVEPKWLTGMVIEPIKDDHDCWMIEQSELDGDALLVMSPAQNIETECRFFVVDNKIVAGSTYRWLGARTIRRPIDTGILGFSQAAIKEWMPSPNIVIDTCRLKNGQYRIVEFNALNSSGFYSADVGAVVDVIEGL